MILACFTVLILGAAAWTFRWDAGAACRMEAGSCEESGVDVTAYKNPMSPLYKRHLMRYTEQQY